ncbi:MAG: redoxin family protein [Candidatus Pacebacteria bacterium]|jgi:thiol-disulfide isomerase/thioredoxin|nr:redoxin family protein [Candidatus Paceibacterota bacterium]
MAKLPKIEGRVWIGPEIVNLDELGGKVVLVDFWTYSCVNCLRTLPYLREWYKKYKDDGLVVIGIHAPEFEFEKDPVNVERAMEKYNVTWPVLLDNEHLNWEHFSNQYWPTTYLSDAGGNIVYTHSGEGAYAETEHKIREVLGIKNPEVAEDWEHNEHAHGGKCGIATPETYCGYLRGWLGNQLGYAEDAEEVYKNDSDGSEGKIQLNGPFFSSGEYVESRSPNASVSLPCRGTEVNLVMSHTGKDPVTVDVLWNREPISAEMRGGDVSVESTVTVDRPGLFHLIKAGKEIEGVIEIRSKTGNFRAHAFTFSGCVGNM